MNFKKGKCYKNLIYAKIADICDKEYPYFFKRKNVVGVGIGYQVKNGMYTLNKCIKVFVTRKLPKLQLLSQDLIPADYKGVLTDVVESGPIKTSAFNTKIRPVVGGYSISPSTIIGKGTMGCLVKDSHHLYLLSNNHVIANENNAPIGTPIVQPGTGDGGVAPTNTIATLEKFIPVKFETLHSSPENFVDCAIGKITDKSLVSSEIAVIGHVRGTKNAKIGEDVQKVGRSTEVTLGTVTATNVTINVNFESGICLFKHQIATTKMSESGDSGSLMLDFNDNAIGINFGDATSYSFFNPILVVLSNLGVSIVTK